MIWKLLKRFIHTARSGTAGDGWVTFLLNVSDGRNSYFRTSSLQKILGITEYVLNVTAPISCRDARHSLVSFIDILTVKLLTEIAYLANFHRLLLLCLGGGGARSGVGCVWCSGDRFSCDEYVMKTLWIINTACRNYGISLIISFQCVLLSIIFFFPFISCAFYCEKPSTCHIKYKDRWEIKHQRKETDVVKLYYINSYSPAHYSHGYKQRDSEADTEQPSRPELFLYTTPPPAVPPR